MRVVLKNAGKQFEKQWVLRNLNGEFSSPDTIAILGQNGTGKSTLIKMLSGYLQPNEGKIEFEESNIIPTEEIYQKVSMAAPWMELIEELTLVEIFHFHSHFRKWVKPFDIQQLIQISGLQHAAHKQLRNYSSGMKQRVKLVLAILTQSSLLLLDEPCSNLDANAIAWYQQLLKSYLGNRLLFVASNHQADEIFCCSSRIELPFS